MQPSDHQAPHYDLAREVAKLWPHRSTNRLALTSLLCGVGIHYWRSLSLGDLYPGKIIQHCFWCSNVRIDRVVYDV
jgi:hypothetical protein